MMTVPAETRPLEAITFREDLYPRIKHDPALVQRYAENLECLPPIEINQHNELIDGWHRWTAHKTAKVASITVNVTETSSDVMFLELACLRNSSAGKQMEERDKKKMAIRLYNGGEGRSKERIAEVLSVTLRMVRDYLQAIDDQIRQEREERMQDMWLACYELKDIAAIVGLDHETVRLFLQKIQKTEDLPKIGISAISHESNFDRKIYGVWNFPTATNDIKIFGNIPPEILDNLLYYYTKPFDVVFDPFVGGGSTIDVCRQRMRRCYASDLTPIEARKHEIRQHDITTGLPENLPVPDFVFLDPPYWKQAEHKYSESPTDLGNVDLDTFLDTIGKTAALLKRKWTGAKRAGKLALIIGPWKHEGHMVDLAFLCYERIAKYLTPVNRFIVPYPTEIHGGAFVSMAQDNKEVLYLHRDLMVFEYANGL